MKTFLKIYDAVLEVILKAFFWVKRNPRKAAIILLVALVLLLIFGLGGKGGEVQSAPEATPVITPMNLPMATPTPAPMAAPSNSLRDFSELFRLAD